MVRWTEATSAIGTISQARIPRTHPAGCGASVGERGEIFPRSVGRPPRRRRGGAEQRRPTTLSPPPVAGDVILTLFLESAGRCPHLSRCRTQRVRFSWAADIRRLSQKWSFFVSFPRRREPTRCSTRAPIPTHAGITWIFRLVGQPLSICPFPVSVRPHSRACQPLG